MGFSGSAPVEKKPAAAAPGAAIAPAAAQSDDADVIAVISAAIAAYDGDGEQMPVIGRLYSPGWKGYARVATVTVRDQMF